MPDLITKCPYVPRGAPEYADSSERQLSISRSSTYTDKSRDVWVEDLERAHTLSRHKDHYTQPSMPMTHHRMANPAPLGMLSFATSIFLISAYGVKARAVVAPNICLGVLVFFGGICQFITGIFEMIAGNTFGATVFPSYGAFNLAYALIYIPSSGILAAYTDETTGEISPEFSQALAIWLWAWFILSCIFLVGAMRSSWVLFTNLAVLCVQLMLLATGYMVDNTQLLTAGSSLGFVVAFLAYYAGTAGLWASGITPINLPTFPIVDEKI